MKALKSAVPLFFCLLILNLAHSKPKKPDLPAVFQNAKYVYVQAQDGDIMKPGLFPEDRQAISDVQDSLRKWNRYAIAINRSDADLVIVIRKGRLAAAQAHGGVSVGSPLPPGGQTGRIPGQTGGSEVGVRTDVGEPEDMLRVYVQNEGELKAMVWNRTMEGGLDAPTVQLVKQLKAAVEKAFPQQPPPQKQP